MSVEGAGLMCQLGALKKIFQLSLPIYCCSPATTATTATTTTTNTTNATVPILLQLLYYNRYPLPLPLQLLVLLLPLLLLLLYSSSCFRCHYHQLLLLLT